MKIHPSIQKKLPALIDFLKQHRVKRAAIFGSATTTDFGPESDLDLLVAFNDSLSNSEYTNHFWGIYLELPKLLGRPVDVVVEGNVKNPYFIEELNETKVTVYDEESEKVPV